MKFLDEHEEFFEALSNEFWKTQERHLEKKLRPISESMPKLSGNTLTDDPARLRIAIAD